ncbi:MAG: phage major tail tube protein [Gammaproteobacteria bacterium]|nr:MAG: phage major tail tube protein [Gammaproteobacteria bacterium]UTW43174.1 phage major tail tube protein [bacterium SCSIO 12844]
MFNNLLENFGVYVDGVAYLGLASEIQLPKISVKTEEWTAAGMSGTVDIDTGKVEKMEAVIKLKGIQTDPVKAIGNTEAPLIIRGSLRNKDGESKKLIIEMRGLLKEYDTGTINAESLGETSITLSLSYYRLNVDNEDLIEVDPINNVRSISGENSLESVLANISN